MIVLMLVTLAGCSLLEDARVTPPLQPAEKVNPFALAAMWRADDGRVLELRKDGWFVSAKNSGCWRQDGEAISFTVGCMNFGRKDGDAFLLIAEAGFNCRVHRNGTALAEPFVLMLSDCPEAGSYKQK
jgi:hypothetical protein